MTEIFTKYVSEAHREQALFLSRFREAGTGDESLSVDWHDLAGLARIPLDAARKALDKI